MMEFRLDKNEMPWPPPSDVINAVMSSLHDINRYTSQDKVIQLIDILSDYAGVPRETIFLNAGSDILIKELIYLFSANKQIIFVDPSFFLIGNTAEKTNSPLLKVRLKEPEFKFNIESIIDDIKKPTLMVIDNPNNPTGNMLLNEKDVLTILNNENIILLIDEAYFEFSRITFANLVDKHPNLAVTRTLSKAFGLAGSGIGYLIAGELIQKQFQGLDVMLPSPSVIAAIAALNNKKYMRNFIQEIDREKKRLKETISDLGLKLFPSFTNFLLMKVEIPDVARKLAEKRVFVSNLSNYSLSPFFIRVTIGSRAENDMFIKILKTILET